MPHNLATKPQTIFPLPLFFPLSLSLPVIYSSVNSNFLSLSLTLLNLIGLYSSPMFILHSFKLLASLELAWNSEFWLFSSAFFVRESFAYFLAISFI